MKRRASAVLLGAIVLSGCAPKIVRLHEAGEHRAVVSHAAQRKRPPKGAAARALAGSLAALGKAEEARSVLVYDFRHGGSVDSLLQLADLELEQGSDGLAAAHYTRALELETTVVANRPNAPEICDLFRRRARAFLSLDEAMAADADMRRVNELCAVSSDPVVAATDAELRAEIEPRAEALVRARAAYECRDACSAGTPAQRQAALEAELAAAREAGPRQLVEVALERGASLEPADVVSVVAAELQGRVYPDEILSSEQLEQLVGYAPSGRLVGALGSMRGAQAAYATVRLVGFLGLSAEDAKVRRDEALLAGLTTLSRTDADASSWRFAAAVGDREGMDLSISTHLRSVGRPRVDTQGQGDSGLAGEGDAVSAADPTISGVERPEGLAGRVFVDRTNLPLLLVHARLRAVRNPRLGLEIERFALAEAGAAEIGGAAELAARSVERHLALGQPWQAAAVAAVAEVSAELRGRIGATLADAAVLCGAAPGGCAALEADRALATLVAGPLEAPASGQPPQPRSDAVCPGLLELLSSTSLGPAVTEASADLGARETGQALSRAVESDLTLACVGSVAAPLLDAGAHDPVARTLTDRFGLVPDPRAARTELTLYRLALAGDRPEQAEVRLRNAAGLAAHPERVWLEAAGRDATRELRLEALRELLLLRPGDPEAETWHRELVLLRLEDANDDPNTRRYAHAQASLQALVDDYLERQPPSRRWRLRQSLIESLAQRAWVDEVARTIVADAVRGPAPERHESALARLMSDDEPMPVGPGPVAEALSRPDTPDTPQGAAYRLRDAGSPLEVARAIAPLLPPGAEARLEVLTGWLTARRLAALDRDPELAIRLVFDLPLPNLAGELGSRP